jgi:hypothetical protein
MATTGAAAATQAARTATAATQEQPRYAYDAARNMADSRRRPIEDVSGFPGWLYWAIPLAILGGVIWWLAANQQQTTRIASTDPQVQITTPGTTPAPAPGVDIAAINANQELTQSITSLRTSLNGITDTTSATAALPQLRDIATRLDRVGTAIGTLSPEARKLVGVDTAAMNNLNQTFDRVLAIPGVSNILKPTVDTLKQKLSTLKV